MRSMFICRYCMCDMQGARDNMVSSWTECADLAPFPRANQVFKCGEDPNKEAWIERGSYTITPEYHAHSPQSLDHYFKRRCMFHPVQDLSHQWVLDIIVDQIKRRIVVDQNNPSGNHQYTELPPLAGH